MNKMPDTNSDFYEQFQQLPKKAKQRVKMNLFYWYQWGNTTVYQKLREVNLTRDERFVIGHILADARQNQDLQTVLQFDWAEMRAEFVR